MATNITHMAATDDVIRVNSRANIISGEKRDSRISAGFIMTKRLPITIKRINVEISEIEIKAISSLLLIVFNLIFHYKKMR